MLLAGMLWAVSFEQLTWEAKFTELWILNWFMIKLALIWSEYINNNKSLTFNHNIIFILFVTCNNCAKLYINLTAVDQENVARVLFCTWCSDWQPSVLEMSRGLYCHEDE